ncbi:hypothetical protein [Flammeovirga agarivorans]|uniref:Uncharacterized protein n=1 Tax=Flammeovirga agarivorans TaxID=2726742 RepID=A0A7X8SM70_9BACT|nr:hypothetical protein [Flammeovirga agarivorans]NLR92788.1 hypothetical protein [Flammeovirga agarivorans]
MNKSFGLVVNMIFGIAAASFLLLAYYDWKEGRDYEGNMKLGLMSAGLLIVRIFLMKNNSRNDDNKRRRFGDRIKK